MGSDERHFNVSLIVRDKVTRQCPQTTTFLKRKESRNGFEPRSYAYEPNALPLGQTGSLNNSARWWWCGALCPRMSGWHITAKTKASVDKSHLFQTHQATPTATTREHDGTALGPRTAAAAVAVRTKARSNPAFPPATRARPPTPSSGPLPAPRTAAVEARARKVDTAMDWELEAKPGDVARPSPANSCWSWRRSSTAKSTSRWPSALRSPTPCGCPRCRWRSGSRTAGPSGSGSRQGWCTRGQAWLPLPGRARCRTSPRSWFPYRSTSIASPSAASISRWRRRPAQCRTVYDRCQLFWIKLNLFPVIRTSDAMPLTKCFSIRL